MKLLLVGDYPDDIRFGSAKVPHKLAEGFRVLGHQCDLLFADDLGTRPKSMHPRQLVGPLLAERAIARAWKKDGPYDIVDIASGEGAIFGLKRRLGFYQNCSFISRSHGIEHLNYERMLDDHRAGLLHKPWTRRLWYPAMRLNQVAYSALLADRLVVLNQSDREFALKRGWKRPEHVVMIPHGVSEHYIEQIPPVCETRGAGILFCGTWTGVKGIDYLVPAFTKLVEDGMEVRLTVLGGGISRDDILDAFPVAVHHQLNIVDRLPEERVIDEYRRHDVFIFCSTYEGFGMTLLEAMSQRLAVVATPVGSATSLVRDGETGLLVPPRNPDALAGAIRRLMGNERLRRNLADNAFRHVRDMTWRHMALKTLEVYQSAANSMHARRVAA